MQRALNYSAESCVSICVNLCKNLRNLREQKCYSCFQSVNQGNSSVPADCADFHTDLRRFVC
jgi:hypothetical protein